jgi:hypothetical protein
MLLGVGTYYNNERYTTAKARARAYKAASRNQGPKLRTASRGGQSTVPHTSRMAWFEHNKKANFDSNDGLLSSRTNPRAMSSSQSVPNMNLKNLNNKNRNPHKAGTSRKGSGRSGRDNNSKPSSSGSETLREAYEALTKAGPNLQHSLSLMTGPDADKRANKDMRERYQNIKKQLEDHATRTDFSATHDKMQAWKEDRQHNNGSFSTSTSSGAKANGPRHPLAHTIPEHQRAIMLSHPNYTPDPDTYTTSWPIPGTQGSRTPFKLVCAWMICMLHSLYICVYYTPVLVIESNLYHRRLGAAVCLDRKT